MTTSVRIRVVLLALVLLTLTGSMLTLASMELAGHGLSLTAAKPGGSQCPDNAFCVPSPIA